LKELPDLAETLEKPPDSFCGVVRIAEKACLLPALQFDRNLFSYKQLSHRQYLQQAGCGCRATKLESILT
jgi:hypothetical protein